MYDGVLEYWVVTRETGRQAECITEEEAHRTNKKARTDLGTWSRPSLSFVGLQYQLHSDVAYLASWCESQADSEVQISPDAFANVAAAVDRNDAAKMELLNAGVASEVEAESPQLKATLLGHRDGEYRDVDRDRL